MEPSVSAQMRAGSSGVGILQLHQVLLEKCLRNQLPTTDVYRCVRLKRFVVHLHTLWSVHVAQASLYHVDLPLMYYLHASAHVTIEALVSAKYREYILIGSFNYTSQPNATWCQINLATTDQIVYSTSCPCLSALPAMPGTAP